MQLLIGRNEIRLQSGCIPYRITNGKIEILLVQSSTSKRWTLPSGQVEPGLTLEENAVKEVYEEAGVEGYLTHDMGTLLYVKTSTGVKQILRLYAMCVHTELVSYPEMHTRVRKWFPIQKARLISKIGSKQIKRLKDKGGI